jgi:autotransporter translocation and assembly factor TamB
MLKFIKYLSLTLLCIFIAIIGFLAFITTSSGEKLLRNQLVINFNKRFDQVLQIEKLETNLLSHLQLEGVRISYEDSTSVQFINLKSVKIEYALFDLLDNNITIDSLLIDNLNVNLDRDSTGSFNLPKLTTKPKPKEEKQDSKYNLILKYTEIKQSSFIYQDKTLPLNGMAGKVESLITQNEMGYYTETAIDSINLDYLDVLYSASDFRLSARYFNDTLALDSINLKIPGFDVAGDAVLDFSEDQFTILGKLALSGSPDQLAETFADYIPEKLKPVSGQLDLKLAIDGSLSDPTIQANIQFPKLRMQNLQLNDGNIELTVSRHFVDIQHLNFNSLKGKASGHGRLELDSIANYEMYFDFNKLSLREINKLILNQEAVYSGRVSGSLQSKGSLSSLKLSEVKGELSVDNINFMDKSIPDLAVLVDSKNGRAELDIKQGESRIKSSIRYTNQNIKGTFSINIPNLTLVAGLLNVKDVSGSLDIHGTIEGSDKYPKIMADFNGSELKYSDIPLDKINGSLTYKNGKLEFDSTSFSGSLDDVSILRKPADLSDLHGGIKYEGQVCGKIDNLKGCLTVELDHPGYKEYKFEKGTIEATIDRNKIELLSLNLEDDSLLFIAGGSFSLKTFSGDIRLNILKMMGQREDMGRLTVVFNISNKQDIIIDADGTGLGLNILSYAIKKPLDITGTLDFTLHMQGNMESPLARTEFQLANFHYNSVFLDSVAGEAVFNGKSLNLKYLRIRNVGNSLQCGGKVNLIKNAEKKLSVTKDSKITGYIRSESFNLVDFGELVPLPLTCTGTVNCSLDFKGTINKPFVNGSITLDNGSLVFPTTTPPIYNLQLTANLNGSSIRIKNLSGLVKDKPFKFVGEFSTNDRRVFKSEFDLTVSNRKVLSGSGEIGLDSLMFDLVASDFDLTMLQSLSPSLSSIQGTLNSSIRLSGPISDPYIIGEITGREIQFKPELLNAPLTNGTLKISFDKKNISLDSLYFSFKDGWLMSTGQAVRQDKGFSSFTFHVNGKNLNSRQHDKYIMEIKSVDLKYVVDGDEYNLTGDIILGESRLLYRFQSKMLLTLLQKSDRPQRPLPEFLQKTKLNVRLRESEKIWIDNNLARMRLHSELAVTGSPAQLNINGRLEVAEGYIIYLDRKFQVIEGTLDFADPIKPNPYISLRAESDVKDYRSTDKDIYKIILIVSGTMEEPLFDLHSEPPLDKPNILSLLTLGMTMDSQTDSRSTGRTGAFADAVRERLEETSSARISGYVSRKTESFLGLNEVTVNGNLFNINNATGPQLLASKKLTDKMEITYITTIGHMNEQGIRLNYYLTKHFSIEGQTDQRGVSGLDLKYRIKF